jgi:hypothetical protein
VPKNASCETRGISVVSMVHNIQYDFSGTPSSTQRECTGNNINRHLSPSASPGWDLSTLLNWQLYSEVRVRVSHPRHFWWAGYEITAYETRYKTYLKTKSRAEERSSDWADTTEWWMDRVKK